MSLVGVLLLLIATLLQAIVLPVLFPNMVQQTHLRPDLLVLLVVAITLVDSLQHGLAWGFVGGMLLDIFAPVAPLGTHALALVLVALLAGLGTASPFRSHFIMPLAMVAVCTLFYYLFLMTLLTILGRQTALLGGIIRLVAPALTINVILMPVFYTFLYWLSNRLRPAALPEEWQ